MDQISLFWKLKVFLILLKKCIHRKRLESNCFFPQKKNHPSENISCLLKIFFKNIEWGCDSLRNMYSFVT